MREIVLTSTKTKPPAFENMKLEFESNTAVRTYDVESSPTVRPEFTAAKVSQMLEAGIKAAQNGSRNEARQMFVQVTEAEPQNETAWLWMASISEYPEELIIFLNNVLSINPNNARALEWMKATKSLLAKTFVQRGTESLSGANTDFARQCFLQAIAHDNQNETAWQSLAEIADSFEDKVAHLQKVISLNPDNQAAQNFLRTARQQQAETVLREANRAAISGEREAAREMLREIFEIAPEMEEAWILRAYLADSFSDKVTSYEKVLTFNPENATAIAGLASLHAMTAKTEAKKVEQAALIAEINRKIADEEAAAALKEAEAEAEAAAEAAQQAEAAANAPEEILILTDEQYLFDEELPPDEYAFETEQNEEAIAHDQYPSAQSVFENQYSFDETAIDGNSPTQKLEFPLNFAAPDYEPENLTEFYSTETAALPEIDAPPETIESFDFYAAAEQTAEAAMPENFGGQTAFEESFAPEVSAPEMSAPEVSEQFYETASFEEAAIEEPSPAETFSKFAPETVACPYCRAENEANAIACVSCRTILTLSDLEMLFAHTEADAEILRQAVERMEAEKDWRPFTSDDYKHLAVGQINLKNLRQGANYLQKAAQMNPNDVMLASQVNVLKIRLAEIEQQESAHSRMVQGRKILIVDDSATVRKLISGKLEKSGHQVVCAADGASALETIKQFVPDLILLDIMMPQLDGYQICKMIRANELTRDVPVVLISGKDGFFDKVRGRMAGATGYIIKPFGPETLMKTVEAYISHREQIFAENELT